MKFFSILFLLLFMGLASYSQNAIKKNGHKINILDKKNRKQGSWFFFNHEGDLELSCYYKNDSIITPLVFYKNNDSIFIRHQKVDKTEVFLLKNAKDWVVGTINTIKADSTQIEILGKYVKTGNEVFDIKEDTLLSNSLVLKKEVEYWSNKEIRPNYMFGNEHLKDFYFQLFSSSKIVFNKRIIVDLIINESGIVEKVDFPRDQNNLNSIEDTELNYLFTRMDRWQPFFSKNKTSKLSIRLNVGVTLH